MALDDVLNEIATLMDEHPEDALSRLDRVYSENKGYDHDGWLEKSVRSHRAMIFAAHHRHEEAQAEIFSIPDSALRTAEERAAHHAERAWIMELRGQNDEALQELSDALAYHSELDAASSLRLLSSYAEIANKEGRVVPDQLGSLLKKVVSELGIPLQEEARNMPLHIAIGAASEIYLEAGRRYEKLLLTVQGKPRVERATLMSDFAQAEPVGFFKDMARKFAEG